MNKLYVVTDAFDSGGAQKMLSFAINSVAECFDKIVVLVERKIVNYKLPDDCEIVEMQPYNDSCNNIFQKTGRLLHYSLEARKLIKNDANFVMAFGSYYSTIAFLATRFTDAKLIVSERRTPQLLSRSWKWISSITYKYSDAIVFQLEGARDFYKSIDKKKTFIIPNPYISNTKITPINSKNRRKVVAMAAARLEYEKGFDIGIQAFNIFKKSHPDYKMEIYGAGDQKSLYGDLCYSDSVEFKGLSSDIISDIKDVAVFVLPSRSEGIPNMLLEALGAGIPCVAADCLPGGPRLLIGDNDRGLLVPVEDINGTAEAIALLIDDNELADRFSKHAQSVYEQFGERQIAEKWKKCIKELEDK